MSTTNYEGKKFENDVVSNTIDTLTVEEALQINVNHEPFTVTMRTPGSDKELTRGLLHSEGIIKSSHYVPTISLSKKDDEIITHAEVIIPEDELGSGYSNSRSLLSVSSCGICGKKELEDVSCEHRTPDKNEIISATAIPLMFEQMNNAQKAFKQSGGSHAAAAFDQNGQLLSIHEDIGRHNAVDKVIGDLILQNQLKKAHVLTVSGRISYEIIIKVFKARIPILCAVSAPSSLAVDYAKELGITLLAFCRGSKSTCYSHPMRVQ